MNRTFDEWVERFNRKIPKKFKRDDRFALFYLPDKGFCELLATDKMVILGQVSGDGRFWKKFAEDTARVLRLKACGTYCGRKEVLAWIRLFGFKVTETEENGGFKRFHGETDDGRWGLMTECVFEDGMRAYQTTWEVK